jgi:LacI family transcriptional regulator
MTRGDGVAEGRRGGNGRATLRDVAQAVGVNPSTASRALNAKTRHLVSGAIERRVRAAAESLGYRPNAIASSLRTRRSHMVAVIVPDITNPLFPPIVRAIEDALRQDGYTAIVANIGYDGARQEELIAAMQAQGVDGFILATARRRDPLIERHAAEGLPIVLVNRRVEADDVAAIVNDDALGIRFVVRHLVELGHRRIAHVAGPSAMSTGHARQRAFLAALAAEGLEAEKRLVAAAAHFNIAEGRATLLKIMARGEPFTAVVAANDLLALGCYEALKERGLSCPAEMSVTGFDDMPFVDRVAPPLTTVRIDHEALGAGAAKALVALIDGRAAAPQHVKLAPQLIVRRSTAAPPRQLRLKEAAP